MDCVRLTDISTITNTIPMQEGLLPMPKPNNINLFTTLYNSGRLERDHHPGEEQGLGEGAIHTVLHEKGKELKDFEISAGSCDVPSESREQEEEGALRRQGQAASRVQDRTNVVEDMLTKEDGVDMSRLNQGF